MEDTSGNVIVGVGTEFILQGPERKGLYVEDEDNYYSCIKQPTSPYLTSYYVEDENNIGSVGKIGTAHSSGTYYKGNGSTGYLRGSSVTARTGYTAYSGKLYDADGVRVNSSTTYFFGGSEKTLYKGDGSYVHDRGNRVDAIEYDASKKELTFKNGSAETIDNKHILGVDYIILKCDEITYYWNEWHSYITGKRVDID